MVRFDIEVILKTWHHPYQDASFLYKYTGTETNQRSKSTNGNTYSKEQRLTIKNEGKDGGWILGIRDDGTKEKPIEIDQDSDKAVSDAESDEDMEEVSMLVL